MFRYQQIRIALLTFALGLAGAGFSKWFREYTDGVAIELPQASSEVFEVSLAPPLSGIEEIGHGCGGRNKYGAESSVTGYRVGDFSNIVSLYSEGHDSKKAALKEIALRIKAARTILNNSSIDSGHRKRTTRRIVLITSDANSERSEIITYDGRTEIEVISAKSLEIVLAFEKWELSRTK